MRSILAFDRRAEASPLFLPALLVFLLALLFYLRGRSLIGYLVQRWSLRARRGGHLTAPLAALEYKEMLRLLERRGWKKSPWQTPLEFAASLPSGDLTEAVTQLTETYQSARFGGHGADLGRVATLLARLEAALRKSRKRR